ncbi:alcohol dehydrogenase catalytic domain-containing protein [Eubacteriales bacterium OttesenSCG-928-N13]|nr:alcohol dehydrogenase catalytic domain-containing protein [Eubacteriales bacterium OttesenSCG-928-N13]
MKCDALWVVDYEQIEIRPIEVPEPLYDEVQIETKACGVCCWDSYQYRGMSGPGPYPYVIGHEAVGIIRKVGEGVTNWKVGQKVFCASGSIIEMAQFFNIKGNCMAEIPADTEDYASWVVEPTCTVQNVLNWANIRAGDNVVLVGAGYMGQLTLMGLHAYPWGTLTVFEKREDRLAMLKDYDLTAAFNPESPEGQAEIDRIIAAGGADHVIEFSASDDGYALALKLVRKTQGRLTVGSWHRHEMKFDGTAWHMGGLIVNNVAPATTFHYEDVILPTAAMVRRGIFKPGKLVTHIADYHDCKHVFDRSVDKEDGYIKGVITF